MKKLLRAYIIALIFFILTIAINPFIGGRGINFNEIVIKGVLKERLIFFNIRLPRVLLGWIAGSNLALSGLILQALLRNPLASPFTLGVASGGALGATIALVSGVVFLFLGVSSLPIFSIIGSIVVIIFIYLFSLKRGSISTDTLILAGVTVNIFCGALIMLFQYLSDYTQIISIVRWLMGGLDIVNMRNLIPLGIISIASLIYLIIKSPSINLLTLGEEFAYSKGVNVNRLKKVLFFIASFLTGSVVALTGPIGFIGLIIPHLIRLIWGTDHRLTVVVSYLFGGIFLIWCDTLARTIIYPAELPVGVITSIIGGPIFITLLFLQFKKRRY